MEFIFQFTISKLYLNLQIQIPIELVDCTQVAKNHTCSSGI